MSKRQPALPRIWPNIWPKIWLVSDARNDAVLEQILMKLPRGSGLIFRHNHLGECARRQRFAKLKRLARSRGHTMALSASPAEARHWGADAVYGPPRQLARGAARFRLVTAHNLRELAQAMRARADAVLLSPVFPTRSHPGQGTLGPVRFRLLAARARVPVIALGGMNARRARQLGATRWAAVDGLCDELNCRIPKDS
ncbi:MAG: thiamine phosphate synthase [Novosphingobium sp.]